MIPSKLARKPREHFTKMLVRLCERLDKCWRIEFPYDKPSWTGVRHQGTIIAEVREVRAFGSWAKGVSECADLDLAVHVEARWVSAPLVNGVREERKRTPLLFSEIRGLFFRRSPGMDVVNWESVLGGGMAIQADNCVPIWRPPVSEGTAWDWRAAIGHLKSVPGAQRERRLTDLLPLSVRQTGMDVLEAEEAVVAMQSGLLSWEFIDHGASFAEELPQLGPEELERISLDSKGRKSLALRARAHAVTENIRRRQRDGLRYEFGNSHRITPGMLKCDVHTVVVTPLWAPRGPNGSLVVSRGPNWSTESVAEWEKCGPGEREREARVGRAQEAYFRKSLAASSQP